TPTRMMRTRANSSPSGMPTTMPRPTPVTNSVAESRACVANCGEPMSCQSRTRVSDSGTRKAGLELRPAISHSAAPARRLSHTGAFLGSEFNRSGSPGVVPGRVLMHLGFGVHHRLGVAPHALVHQPLVLHRLLVGLDAADLLHHPDQALQPLAVEPVVV